jgi:hypothetical protein
LLRRPYIAVYYFCNKTKRPRQRPLPAIRASAFPAAAIALPFPLPAAARGTRIPQSLRAADVVDPRLVSFAGHLLPNLPTPFPEFATDEPQLIRDLFQPLPDDLNRPLYGFDAAPGNTCSKSRSNPSAKLMQISSALFSFAFTLATALAISRLAESS